MFNVEQLVLTLRPLKDKEPITKTIVCTNKAHYYYFISKYVEEEDSAMRWVGVFKLWYVSTGRDIKLGWVRLNFQRKNPL